MALVLAIGVRDNGEREVLGFDIGLCEDGAFWTDFLRRLVARGLRGVELVISDAHEGLKQAIEQVLTGATWQRCRVHVMRNILSQVPKSSQGMVSAIIRTIFAQPSYEAAKSQLQARGGRAVRTFSESDGDLEGSGRRRACVHDVSESALATDPFDESVGEVES